MASDEAAVHAGMKRAMKKSKELMDSKVKVYTPEELKAFNETRKVSEFDSTREQPPPYVLIYNAFQAKHCGLKVRKIFGEKK